MRDSYFAIVFPVFNTELYVAEALDSIIKQTFPNFVVYAIDDCSSDKTPELLDRYAEKDNRILVKHLKKNVGVSEARNIALREIEADSKITHVVFVDSDDMVHPDYLKVVNNAFSRHMVDLVICNLCLLTKDGLQMVDYPRLEKCLKVQDVIDQTLCLSDWPKYSLKNWGLLNRVFKKEALTGLRFKKSIKLGEDLEFLFQAIGRLKTAFFTSETLYYYRSRQTSATHSSSMFYEKSIQGLLLLLDSYADSKMCYFARVVCFENLVSFYLRTLTYNGTKEGSAFYADYFVPTMHRYATKDLPTKLRLKIFICALLPGLILEKLFLLRQFRKHHYTEKLFP